MVVDGDVTEPYRLIIVQYNNNIVVVMWNIHTNVTETQNVKAAYRRNTQGIEYIIIYSTQTHQHTPTMYCVVSI